MQMQRADVGPPITFFFVGINDRIPSDTVCRQQAIFDQPIVSSLIECFKAWDFVGFFINYKLNKKIKLN